MLVGPPSVPRRSPGPRAVLRAPKGPALGKQVIADDARMTLRIRILVPQARAQRVVRAVAHLRHVMRQGSSQTRLPGHTTEAP